jgi:DNA gyrase inhibitor GyrI
MDVKIIKLEEIIIAGCSVETTAENNDKDINLLYNSFMHNGLMEKINRITNNKKEYYGVVWYTESHKKYKYFLGQKISNSQNNDHIEIKIIPSGDYCFIKFTSGYNITKAWVGFYY